MDWIHFRLHDRQLLLNKNDHNCIMIFQDFKTPKWRKIKLGAEGKGYLRIRVWSNGKEYDCLMHRVVYYAHNQDWNIHDSTRDNSIDHIDNNRQNNQIDNLRVVTNRQNCQNRKNVKGYTWNKERQKWKAKIKINGKDIHLGYYENESEAREAYLKAKSIYHINDEFRNK